MVLVAGELDHKRMRVLQKRSATCDESYMEYRQTHPQGKGYHK
jgi:hypothetical protein